MRPNAAFRLPALFLGGTVALTGLTAGAADAPSAKLALSFRPVQKDVDYETPDAKDVEKCQVKVERSGKASGWVVLSPNGHVLRRFTDTNGDNVVDQWKYYNLGLEVYRDVDTDFNNKVDQSRWLTTAGSRWGLDRNEDGKIDEWKVLSAQEATREAVRAMADRDERLLQTLLITADDLEEVGLDEELAKKILESATAAPQKLRDLRSSSVTAATKWIRFDTSMPSVIPAEGGKADVDLTVYPNAMAIAETSGKTVLLQVGEMIKIGDTWKLTQLPQPLEGNTVQVTVGGVLMQPDFPTAGTSPVAQTSPEMQKLLEQLQKLDQNSPQPTNTAAVARYNRERAELLAQIVEKSKGDEERAQWTRQMVDGIAASVQTGVYPEGLKRLKDIQADVSRTSDDKDLLAYVTFRTLLAEYSTEMQNASNSKRQEVQEWWLKQLEDFVATYPKADDAAEALLQLAITQEFAGKLPEAKKWYTALVDDHGKTTAGARAAGAVKRLDLKDKPFAFSGPGLNGGTIDSRSYRGKVLLVVFWSTWCKPCTEDLPVIRALYQQYRDQGFEIIGVNLDTTAQPVPAYLSEHKVTWPQVFAPGGLESPPAIEYGIISLPTMFLVDADGKVVSRGVSVDDLKTSLPDLLKKK